MRFSLGQTVMTRGIADRIEEEPGFGAFVYASMGRYTNCDWGDTCEADKKTNDVALIIDGRILAVYSYRPGEDIWIITEWDRSVTTILFPYEY